MHAETLKALKGSIKKWEAIADGSGVDMGGENCPLCQKFCGRPKKKDCEGCPVMTETGEPQCFGTPYYDFRLSGGYDSSRGGRAATTSLARQHADAMCDMLRSLLPKPKKPLAKKRTPAKRATSRNRKSP